MLTIPEKNDKITITRNKVTGDRSFAHDIFEVININKTHVQVKALSTKSTWFNNPYILSLDEHEFSLAEDFTSNNS